jgi:L-ectoine synthase
MIVRRLDALEGDRTVSAPTWTSRRLLLADDGMGFSMHDTVLAAGTTTEMWYRNHVEAVYCIAGTGHIDDLETGERFDIAPGTIYALDAHHRHRLHAATELRMVCVFNPPLVGPETHDADGVYPLLEPEDRGAAK